MLLFYSSLDKYCTQKTMFFWPSTKTPQTRESIDPGRSKLDDFSTFVRMAKKSWNRWQFHTFNAFWHIKNSYVAYPFSWIVHEYSKTHPKNHVWRVLAPILHPQAIFGPISDFQEIQRANLRSNISILNVFELPGDPREMILIPIP